MNSKIKECFAPHALYHSLFGLGLGLLIAYFFSSVVNIWLAVILMVIAVVLDYFRK